MSLVSVIIPAYNVEKYLARCLDSVCGQSYRDIEIIVVDDGSADRTPQICDDFADRDNRIKVIHKKNAGVASARNDALDIASGDMIAFADADDYYETDMIGELYNAMAEYGADMVSCGYYEEYPDRVDRHGAEGGISVYDKTGAYEDYFRMGGRLGSGCWNKLIRADAIGDLRFRKFKLGEDVEFICHVLDRCSRIVCIDYAGYHYVHRKDSATREEFGPTNLEILRISDEMLEFIRSVHPELMQQMYAFHAAWYSAQIQVMHWYKDTSKYADEKRFIRNRIRSNLKEYKRNPYIVRADRLFIYSFMLGCYRPVKKLYDTISSIKR